jgi:hypothetical protein
MIVLYTVQITPRDGEVWHLLPKDVATSKSPEVLYICPNGKTASAHVVSARGNHRRTQTRELGDRWICEGADAIMQPRDQ